MHIKFQINMRILVPEFLIIMSLIKDPILLFEDLTQGGVQDHVLVLFQYINNMFFRVLFPNNTQKKHIIFS